jgi:hypothetical protein
VAVLTVAFFGDEAAGSVLGVAGPLGVIFYEALLPDDLGTPPPEVDVHRPRNYDQSQPYRLRGVRMGHVRVIRFEIELGLPGDNTRLAGHR